MKLQLTILTIFCLVSPIICRKTSGSKNSTVSYLRTSIPAKIFRCMNHFNAFRCTKMFILQKLETAKNLPKGGNVKADFLYKILIKNDDPLQSIDKFYSTLTDKELNTRLYAGFSKIFNDRVINLRFIPGMVVKVQPSKTNLIDMSFKKELIMAEDRQHGSGSMHKNKYMLQLGIPAFFMPIAFLGTIMPILLPFLKAAALITGTVNNAALLGALMYLARQASLDNEQKNTVYFNGGL